MSRRPLRRVPFEITTEEFLAMAQAQTYRDVYHGAMGRDERRQWLESDIPALQALRVFSCGAYIEARSHGWEREGLNEGVLIYCTGGKGQYRQDGRSWGVAAGDLLYCPPMSNHGYWADDVDPWTIFWMHLSGERLADYERLLGLRTCGPVRHIGVRDDIIAEFMHLVRQFHDDYDDARRLAIQGSALGILGRIASVPPMMDSMPVQVLAIQKAMDLMENEFDKPFELDRYARAAGYAPAYFSRLFKNVAGKTPLDYFNRRKMLHARAMLTVPGLPIKVIAARLGYDDPLYFSKSFKRIIGESPTAYRNRAHDDESHPRE